jgi:hypothetical protein
MDHIYAADITLDEAAQALHNPVRAKGRKTVSNKEFYVYAIYVDGVVRYIGKGSNGRVHFHVIGQRPAPRPTRKKSAQALVCVAIN